MNVLFVTRLNFNSGREIVNKMALTLSPKDMASICPPQHNHVSYSLNKHMSHANYIPVTTSKSTNKQQTKWTKPSGLVAPTTWCGVRWIFHVLLWTVVAVIRSSVNLSSPYLPVPDNDVITTLRHIHKCAQLSRQCCGSTAFSTGALEVFNTQVLPSHSQLLLVSSPGHPDLTQCKRMLSF